jgi:hypothetical protein
LQIIFFCGQCLYFSSNHTNNAYYARQLSTYDLKTLKPGGIRTRVFCSGGGGGGHCARELRKLSEKNDFKCVKRERHFSFEMVNVYVCRYIEGVAIDAVHKNSYVNGVLESLQ